MQQYQLAQINIARMKGVDLQDPIMQEFTENLDRINGLAESSPGFVWRLKEDGITSIENHPFEDMQTIITISVWEDLASLEAFTFKSLHSDFLRRRADWFHKYGTAAYALWWIPVGEYPSLKSAVAKLNHLQEHGSSAEAFDFKRRFDQPIR